MKLGADMVRLGKAITEAVFKGPIYTKYSASNGITRTFGEVGKGSIYLVGGGLTKSFGKTAMIMGVDLEISKGERQAFIGPIVAGKSILFNLITGRFSLSSSAVYLLGKNLGSLTPYQIKRLALSRYFHITNIFPRMTVFRNLHCVLLWSKGNKYSFCTWSVMLRTLVMARN